MNAVRSSTSAPTAWLAVLPGVAHSLLLALMLAGLLLAGRRLATEVWDPVPLGSTAVAALVLLAATTLLRWAAAGRILVWLPSLVLVVWALACSFPGVQVGALVLWAVVIGLDGYAGVEFNLMKAVDQTSRPDIPATLLHSTEALSPGTPPHGLHEGETVLQQVMRVRDNEGREYVYATLRGEFEPGQRAANLFVGFCPPFEAPPQVEAEIMEGAPAVAKVVQALHNGAQVEVDLDAPSMQASYVTVELAAFEPPDE